MKFWIFLWSAFVISTKLVACKRAQLIDNALKKACEIITQTLFEAKTPEDKAEVLKNVEEKWYIFSPTIEINEEFRTLVIHAIKSMVTRDDYRLCTNLPEMDKDILLKMHGITDPSPTLEFVSTTTKREKNKELLKKEMVHKIDALVGKALERSKTDDDKQKTIDFIKNRVAEAFTGRETSKNNTVYTEIISNGIDMVVKPHVKTKNISSEKETQTQQKIRLRNEAALGKIENLVYKSLPSKPSSLLTKIKPTLKTEIDHYNKTDTVDNNMTETVTPGPFIGLTKEYDCSSVMAKTCSKLAEVTEFKCEVDDVVIGIDQFCDGFVDCADASDEANCIKHVTKKIHTATKIMTEIDLTKFCYEESVGKTVLPQQADVLTKLLNQQVAFIDKYSRYPKKDEILRKSRYGDVLAVVIEVVAIVKSFGHSMNTALCLDAGKEADKIIEESETLLDVEHSSSQSVREMISECDCTDQVCFNPCSATCKRFCYQTYSLSRWMCKPTKEGAVGVALDDLCNGKIDCLDETDELNCATEPFEANYIYEELLKQIEVYSLAKYFEVGRSRITSLLSGIRLLQTHSRGVNINNNIFKTQRDNIFQVLSDIYTDIVEEYNDMTRAEDAYTLLLSVNEKIVRALKLSYTGNVKIQPLHEACTCLGKKCTHSNCTKECIRQCFVLHLLTTYPCSNSSGNMTVPVTVMCNGRAQCPKGEEEENCRNEICRNHHLVVLRHMLQVELAKYKHTSLEGVLEAWREKASKRISNIDTTDRLSPMAYKMLLHDIVKDLADTYVSNESMEESKMIRNERILKKYYELSMKIKELAKSCTT